MEMCGTDDELIGWITLGYTIYLRLYYLIVVGTLFCYEKLLGNNFSIASVK